MVVVVSPSEELGDELDDELLEAEALADEEDVEDVATTLDSLALDARL